MTPEGAGTQTGSPTPLRLEVVTRAHAEALADMAREFLAAGDPRLVAAVDDPDGFFARTQRFAEGRDLPPERVPQTHYLLLRGTRLLGGARLRHRLIPVLHRDGGNVGYEIRPTERRRGLGTALLGLVADAARGRGMTRLLVTTARTNLPSIRVIEHHGGVPDGTSVSPHTGETMLRYWIHL